MGDSSDVKGFVSLKSVRHGAPDAAAALADIRRIYFKTTKKTIEHDLAHAIELLKSLPTEEERERATVFMEGLAAMRREWGPEKKHVGGKRKRAGAEMTERTGSHGGTAKRGRSGREKKT